MKKKRLIKILPIVLSAVLLFMACAPAANNANNTETPGSTETQSGTSAKTGDLMADVKGESWPAAGNIDEKVKKSLQDFAWVLFRESSANKGNIMISPASVYLALGMALNGADGDTKEAMLKALKANGISEEALNTACRDLVTLLTTKNKKTELSIANSIWYRTGYIPDPAFLKKNADYFRAAAQARDFSSPETLAAINGWVKEATKGTIDKIVDQIDPLVIMYLINAVYFKSEWLNPFEGSKTSDSVFKSPGGDVTAKFMHREGAMEYIDKDGAKGVILPYADENFRFFAVLPKEGQDPRGLIASLDGSSLDSLLASVKNGNVELALPKFKTRYEDSLVNEMEKLGMGVAFNPDAADFSLMNEKRLKDLYITEIKHKTFCNVDELGTEAAAVTSIEMRTTAAQPTEGIRISFDRPFVYGIVDTVSGSPLFLGIMEDPAK